MPNPNTIVAATTITTLLLRLRGASSPKPSSSSSKRSGGGGFRRFGASATGAATGSVGKRGSSTIDDAGGAGEIIDALVIEGSTTIEADCGAGRSAAYGG